MQSTNQFDASGSLAGYLFQCRLALLLGLQTVKKKPNGQISIEKFDDISIENGALDQKLIQAKHHVAAKKIGNMSVDLWKTIRIWVDGIREGVVTASDVKRFLITTAIAEDSSALVYLRPGSSTEQRKEARIALQQAAKASKNKDSEPGRTAFLSLSDAEADILLANVEVIDEFPGLVDVKTEIEGELLLLSPDHAQDVAEALEGWWLGVVSKRLMGEDNTQIPLQHLIRKASEIGTWYKPGGLPIADPADLSDREYDPADEAEIYVRQMRLIKLKDSAINRGVRDFYRAAAQRSKWARESLLLDGETADYDERLKDQWARRFDADCSGLDNDDEAGSLDAGRKIFFWASQMQIGFRNVVETWITAGSFHGLANKLEVGWHPKYQDHLKGPG